MSTAKGIRSDSFQNDDKNHQNDDQPDDSHHPTATLGTPSNPPKSIPRSIKSTNVSFGMAVDFIQQPNLALKFIANLYTELVLSAYRLSQAIQLIILLPHNLCMLLVNFFIRIIVVVV